MSPIAPVSSAYGCDSLTEPPSKEAVYFCTPVTKDRLQDKVTILGDQSINTVVRLICPGLIQPGNCVLSLPEQVAHRMRKKKKWQLVILTQAYCNLESSLLVRLCGVGGLFLLDPGM